VAEWSKALVLGTSLSGRGFESHRCQHCYFRPLALLKKQLLEMKGIEPLASRMRIERSTTELQPHGWRHIKRKTGTFVSTVARLAEWSKA
jgi:hypothetical protein